MSYKEQASLAYGADWCRKDIRSSTQFHVQAIQQPEENHELTNAHTEGTSADLIATCSFYDHALNLWQVKW